MKIILTALLITILAVPESKAKSEVLSSGVKVQLTPPPQIKSTSVYDNESELNPNELFDPKKLLEEKMENRIEKLKVASRKTRELPKFQKIGQKFYYIEHTEKVNWFAAAYKCREMDANLANFKSMKQLKAIRRSLTKRNYWLDINDLGHEGEFLSLTSGRKTDFSDWHATEPNNLGDNEHCVELRMTRGKYALNDNECETKFHFICEKDQLD